ncbi:MAG: lactate utilization protein [Lentimicrobiaceae bacterium]|nr:lactate utilization protein [Lentimicrobiaceae bacterium]
MAELYEKFLKEAEEKAFDSNHRKKLDFNISKYDLAVVNGKKQYSNLETAKKRAAHIKHKVINELDKYLIEFELNFEKRGGKVIWAIDAEDAVKEILFIMKRHHAKHVVKSKSMISEELELNENLEKNKIESLETDLGEFIVQIAGEKPYHLLTPAMHKSKEDIAELFHKKYGLNPQSKPEEITVFVRQLLREKFYTSDIGITGGNFIIADIGAVALTENEGNGVMSIAFPKVHIVVTGIEKVIPSIKDLSLFWPLLSTHGTGQKLTVYNSIISGPKQDEESDGPESMYVILLDNNRSEVLSHIKQRRAMSCIRCGACVNACPIYRSIGGYVYNTTYSGPIGSVISPHLRGMDDYKHLSFASSLCGRCTEVCPMKINLHELLLYNRDLSVKQHYNKTSEKILMFGMKKVLLSRKLMNTGAGVKNKLFTRFFAKTWGRRRSLPIFPPKNFNQLWMEKKSN